MTEAKQEHMILRMVNGDEQAWSQFVIALGPKIQRSLDRITDDQEAREDATSEILSHIVSIFGGAARELNDSTKE